MKYPWTVGACIISAFSLYVGLYWAVIEGMSPQWLLGTIIWVAFALTTYAIESGEWL